MKGLVKGLTTLAVCGSLLFGLGVDNAEAAKISGEVTIHIGSSDKSDAPRPDNHKISTRQQKNPNASPTRQNQRNSENSRYKSPSKHYEQQRHTPPPPPSHGGNRKSSRP